MVKFSLTSASRDPDAQLMLKVRAGSHEAFNALLDRYEDRVRGIIAHLMGGTAHAEDLTQEVFLRVFRARRSYVVGAKFSTWLFTIVNNVVLNARRTLARRKEVGIDYDAANRSNPLESFIAPHSNESPTRSVELTETCELVRCCIGRLGDRQQAAVTLCDLEGKSYAGVAAAIGTSEDAAKSLIHRGRSNLKRMLESHVRRGNVL